MNITLNTEKTIVTRPAETKVVTSVTVERIIDIPGEKSVYVFLNDIGRVKLETLSGVNYNNPPWTDELVLDAVTTFVNNITQ